MAPLAMTLTLTGITVVGFMHTIKDQNNIYLTFGTSPPLRNEKSRTFAMVPMKLDRMTSLGEALPDEFRDICKSTKSENTFALVAVRLLNPAVHNRQFRYRNMVPREKKVLGYETNMLDPQSDRLKRHHRSIER